MDLDVTGIPVYNEWHDVHERTHLRTMCHDQQEHRRHETLTFLTLFKTIFFRTCWKHTLWSLLQLKHLSTDSLNVQWCKLSTLLMTIKRTTWFVLNQKGSAYCVWKTFSSHRTGPTAQGRAVPWQSQHTPYPETDLWRDLSDRPVKTIKKIHHMNSWLQEIVHGNSKLYKYGNSKFLKRF